jgi:uncharacterized protein (TIGR00255 family)
MAVVSMTGFAESQGGRENLRWRWEAKSVNGRGLDMRLRIPPGFESVEAASRPLAGARFKRGTIQATLTLETSDGTRGLRIDAVALGAAVKIAKEIAAETGLPPARIDGLLALKGVIVQEDTLSLSAPERGARDAAILESLAQAFDALARARANEGNKLANVLTNLLGEISDLVMTATKLAATQPATLRDRLTTQLTELLTAGAVSEDRLAQEVALLAARADVREELDRLAAHVHEARALLSSGEAVGRKLDFLSQEFNREANTLCSKSADIQLTRTGLALKAAIDQVREQAQNVE